MSAGPNPGVQPRSIDEDHLEGEIAPLEEMALAAPSLLFLTCQIDGAEEGFPGEVLYPGGFPAFPKGRT